jgi:hypothetical protein
LIRNLPRRLKRLETQAAVLREDNSFLVRIHFVDPEKGLTGIMLLESGKPTIEVAPTPAEVESVRASLNLRRERAGIASDIAT